MSAAIYDHRETSSEGKPSDALPPTQKVAPKQSFRRPILFSLSLANICFVGLWATAIGVAASPEMKYFEMVPPSPGFTLSLSADILILAFIIYTLLWIKGRFRAYRTPAAVLLAAISCFAVLELEHATLRPFNFHSRDTVEISLATLTLASNLIAPRRFRAVVTGPVLILFPLLPLLVSDAAWAYSRPDLQSLRTDHVAGKLASVSTKNRFIWIIFDEMDYHVAFEARPARLQMPEFDRLQSISMAADHATAPAGQTILSMPSFLIGQRVVEEKQRTSDIALRFSGTAGWQDLTSLPNVFRTARAEGLNSAVAGWHHPYCRVLANDLSDCAAAPYGNDSIAMYKAISILPFWRRNVSIAVWQAESLPLGKALYHSGGSSLAGHSSEAAGASSVAWLQPILSLQNLANTRSAAVRQQQIAAAKLITENAFRMAQDPDLNLILVHAPAPHLPGIWDSRKKQFTATATSDYVDNLAFTDFVLGKLRSTLQKKGLWDRTALLISADHPFRTGVWKTSALWTPELAGLTKSRPWPYVPFILKLPGETKPFSYHRPFNTVVSGQLALQILNGSVSTPEQVTAWLDKHNQ